MGGDGEAGEATPPSLEELVARTQAGDRAAMEVLFRRLLGPVKQTARILLGRRLRSHLDSDEVLQESLLAALAGLGKFEYRDEAGLVHWLARIVRNRIHRLAEWHFADMRDRDREVPLDGTTPSDDGDAHQLPGRDTPPPEGVLRSEWEDAVQACLDELPEDYRECLVLVTYLGASWEQVAREIGRSVGASKMLHRRAVFALGRQLRKRGFRD